MVAMGASFADRAWGRESAVYRVTGVLAVVGGWLMTALVAFSVAGLAAVALFYGKAIALLGLMGLVAFVLYKNHARHTRRMEQEEQSRIFNLKKVSDLDDAVNTTFMHVGRLLDIVGESVDNTMEGLFASNVYVLKAEEARAEKIRQWSNIIIANAFKSLRLLQQQSPESTAGGRNYLQVVRRLQKIADGQADIAARAYEHVANHHKGLIDSQADELRDFKNSFVELMHKVGARAASGKAIDPERLREKKDTLKALSAELQNRQLDRIQSGEAKTRLSILYFALLGNMYMLASQVFQLWMILEDTLAGSETGSDVYAE
jgi:hypothetical protein